MKFVVDAKDIQQAIKLIAPVVNVNNSTNALRYIKITKTDNRIEIKGYNDFIFASAFLTPAEIEGEDTCYVFAKTFFDIVKTFSGSVNITITEQSCELKSYRSKYKINVLDESTFKETIVSEPDYYVTEFDKSKDIKLSDLQVGIKSVHHCLSNDDFNLPLQHIFFQKDPNSKSTKMIACDSIMGAVMDTKFDSLDGCLIHKRIIDCILNIENANTINFKIEDGLLVGATHNFIFSSSVSDIEYPHEEINKIINNFISQVKPKNVFKYTIPIKQDSWLSALSRLLYLTDKETNSITMKVYKNNVSLEVEGINSGAEMITINPIENSDVFELSVDAKNLRNALNHSVGEIQWYTDSSKDVQYVADADMVQFFFGLDK